ncbi:hypothetical protein LWI29_017256 [Acer saccharum]|uniref:Uncharacterized protein n=1 Tax=Acer saccharum TaxID=4024 RepID=A0AA39T3W5_ACESA|nr:hypothetical protein LWI29_017256 [Acer saccharum]
MWLLSNKIDRQELKPGLWRSHLLLAAGLHLCSSRDIRWRREGYSFNQENGRVIISSSLPNPQISDVPCPQCGDHNSSFNTGVILSCIDCFFLAANSTSSSMESHGFTFLPKSAEGRAHLPLLTHQKTSFIAPISSSRKALVNMISRSGLSGQVAALEATSGWIFSSLALLTNKFRGLAAVGSGVYYYCYSRLTSDIGVRHDVAKVAVEAVEMVVGPPPPPPPSPPISTPSAPILE